MIVTDGEAGIDAIAPAQAVGQRSGARPTIGRRRVGGAGTGSADGGDNGGFNPYLDDPIPVEPDGGAGGDGGWGTGTGGSGSGGGAIGGHAEGGDAGHDVDVNVTQDAPVF